jgi:peptide/nickel transport system ATP-binding protein
VDGVSLDIPRGTAVALVGESGCGKTMTALSLARLMPQPAGVQVEGRVLFEGEDVLRMQERRLRGLRGVRIAYVFQEAGEALNPALRAGDQILEALRIGNGRRHGREEAVTLAKRVGLPDPERRLDAYPHEMSGGMQQRVMIAMAIASRPQLLVADEPTTALDVTIQAQILELIKRLQRETHMAVLLITHNLGLVADFGDFVHVMYAGRIVESGRAEDVLRHAAHPYTRALLDAVPRLDSGGAPLRRLEGIGGSVPHPARLPAGCKFAPRCSRAAELCRAREPEIGDIGESEGADRSHRVRCWFPICDSQLPRKESAHAAA